MTDHERPIGRVVIACDSVGEYQASIDAAAQLATWLGAQLHGVFIEDEALLDLAAMPSIRHVGSTGEIFAPMDERAMHHQFAAHAGRVRAAIEKAARAQEISWSFDVVRGRPRMSVFGMSDQDLLVIEAESRPFAGGVRLASRLTIMALESEKPILLLRGRPGATQGIVALVQSSVALAAPLIMRAARLASAGNQSLTLFLRTDAGDEPSIIDVVRSVSQTLAERCRIERANRNTLANVAIAGRLLIVDADPGSSSSEAVKALLATTQADILLLR
jgi:hypothetical protein